MTASSTPETPPAAPPSTTAASPVRPAGETGGHTVQDWEQPSPRPTARTLSNPGQDAAEPAAAVPASMASQPEPEVVAVYLRPQNLPRPQVAEPVARATLGDEDVQRPPAGPETLADVITRTVTGLLERSLHESVTAAVRALAPRMVISFPGGLEATPEGPLAGSLDPSAAAADAVEPGEVAPAAGLGIAGLPEPPLA